MAAALFITCVYASCHPDSIQIAWSGELWRRDSQCIAKRLHGCLPGPALKGRVTVFTGTTPPSVAGKVDIEKATGS